MEQKNIEEIKEDELYYNIYFNVFFKAAIHEQRETYQDVYIETLKDVDILNMFSVYINDMIKDGFISIECMRNIKDICFKLRYIEDDKRTERIGIINNLLLYLNQQEEDKSMYFYFDEYAYRFNIFKKRIYEDEIIRFKDEIVESIKLDPLILNTQTERYSDEDFETFVDVFASNPVYIISLNNLLTSYSEYTVNPLFLNRSIKVVNKIIENAQTKTQKRVNKNILKNIEKIKRKIK